MRFWIIYILVQISFLWTALGHFSQCFFIFRRQPAMVADNFTQPPPRPLSSHSTNTTIKKKLPTALQVQGRSREKSLVVNPYKYQAML